MNDDLDAGVGKSAYNDYISAFQVWFIPYFGNIDISKINLKRFLSLMLGETKNGERFSQSGINNHNAALNKVLDEAELNGWITKAMRPIVEQRCCYKAEVVFQTLNIIDYLVIKGFSYYDINTKAAATRETLRNYVMVLVAITLLIIGLNT